METILGLVAATIRVFNITNEELLEAVVDEPVESSHTSELYECKTATQGLPILEYTARRRLF